MAPRNPYRAEARVIPRSNADGSIVDVVQISGGTRTLAVDFSELPALITKLEQINQDHRVRERLLAGLVTS